LPVALPFLQLGGFNVLNSWSQCDLQIPNPLPAAGFHKWPVCANHDGTHQGLKARCKGMTDAMKKIGVSVDELVIGADPARARSTMQSYLGSNKDVNYIFTLGTLSCPRA
jgi:hypothetical protein